MSGPTTSREACGNQEDDITAGSRNLLHRDRLTAPCGLGFLTDAAFRFSLSEYSTSPVERYV
jgi:hypothetical protein